MTEYQLIILQTIVEQVAAKSLLNSDKHCFEQIGPLDLQMELSEYLELFKIKIHLDDLLEDISRMVG